jgi:NAD(P)-dependent dehydrogenase (short-subunit alcohol dehydrogenase family)
MNLKNKVIVITGGTRGLGLALAYSFLKEEVKVVICSKNVEDFKNLSSEIFCVKADVTKEEELNGLLEKTLEKFGDLDLWINNAGVWLPHNLAEDFEMEKVKNMFDVNVFGLINGTRVALRFMKKKGAGTIINVISDSALAPRPMSSMYSSSKWAVRGFSESIREEDKNISILSIYPGAIKTNIFGDYKPDTFNDFMEVEDVANVIIENLKKEKPEEDLVIKK